MELKEFLSADVVFPFILWWAKKSKEECPILACPITNTSFHTQKCQSYIVKLLKKKKTKNKQQKTPPKVILTSTHHLPQQLPSLGKYRMFSCTAWAESFPFPHHLKK